MIAMLTGEVIDVTGGICVLEVSGVGYEVHVPVSALEELAQKRGPVTLHTYLHLREDGVQLFGFLAAAEKKVFERLIGVSGVGPKLGLSALSVLNADRLCQAIEAEDCRLISSVPGIGMKTAQRLVLELRGKLTPARLAGGAMQTASGGAEAADAIDALVALGYPAAAAMQAVDAALADGAARTASALVRVSLKKLTR